MTLIHHHHLQLNLGPSSGLLSLAPLVLIGYLLVGAALLADFESVSAAALAVAGLGLIHLPTFAAWVRAARASLKGPEPVGNEASGT